MPTIDPADVINAQLYEALHRSERALSEIANGCEAGQPRETAQKALTDATNALLASEPGSRRVVAALALVDHLELVQMALASLKSEAGNMVGVAASQGTAEMQMLARQLEKTEVDCDKLLAVLSEIEPPAVEAFDEIENQDTLEPDMAC